MHAASTSARVLIVDDHVAVRRGIADLLGMTGRYTVGAEAASAEQALEMLRNSEFEIAVVDLSLPGLSGIDLTRSIRALHPRVPVVVLSMHDESQHGDDAVDAGASAYVTKSEATEKLLPAIEQVLAGNVYFGKRLWDRALRLSRAAARAETVDPPAGSNVRRSGHAVRIAQLGYWTYTPGTGHAEWSGEMYRVMGCDPGTPAPGHEEFLRLVHSTDRESVRAQFDAAVRMGEVFEVDLRLKTPGEQRWVRLVGEPILDPSGVVQQLHGAATDVSERKRAEQTIRRAEERYRNFIALSSEAIFRFTHREPVPTGLPAEALVQRILADAVLAESNLAHARLYGFSNEQEPLGLPLESFGGPDANRELVDAFVRNGFRLDGKEWSETIRGELKWFRGSMLGIVEGGMLTGAWGTQTDISESKRAEEDLRRNDTRFRALTALSSDWYWETDTQHKYQLVSWRWREQRHVQDTGAMDWSPPRALLESREPFRDHVFQRNDARGEARIISVSGDPVAGPDGEFEGYCGVSRDLTASSVAETRIFALANFDELTGLPNGALFRRRLDERLEEAERERGGFAVAVLDIDRLKHVNSALGHSAGDGVLLETARRLRECLPPDDVIARLGGDEFAILLGRFDDRTVDVLDESGGRAAMLLDAAPPLLRTLEDAAQSILAAMARPFPGGRSEIHLSASLGVSTWPNDSADGKSLLRHAESALSAAKGRGGGTVQFYAAQMTLYSVRRLTLENGLLGALERGEIEVHYQPKVDPRAGRAVGAEALARWRHPALGVVLPEEFIALASGNGSIVPIGRWMLRGACLQAAAWAREGLGPLRVAVNLSAREFARQNFAEDVAAALADAALDPGRLELEIAESALLQDAERAAATLRRLKQIGVRLTIDDFGSGASSLALLKRLPFDGVKLTRSFLAALTEDADVAALVQAIVGFAQRLRLRVAATGIETEAQQAFLASLGCDELQGHLLCAPLETAAFAQHMRAQAPAAAFQ